MIGRVTSADGEPLAQATVVIERWGLGATTRSDGRYTIALPTARLTGDTVSVIARLIGYKPRTSRVVLAGVEQTLDFSLEANPLQLGEIVVTGLGGVSEVEKLGTVRSSIDSAQIIRSGEQNLINSLAAKAPNVTVTSSSGDPGASSFIQIRGLTTISAQDGQPLIVVDGVPVDNSISYNNPISGALNSSSSPSNRAIDINPNDIENVEVLKGPASSAVYGSRAGSGRHPDHHEEGPSRPDPVLLPHARSRSISTPISRTSRRKYGLGTGGAPPACVDGRRDQLPGRIRRSGELGAVAGCRARRPSITPTRCSRTATRPDNALTVSGRRRTHHVLPVGRVQQQPRHRRRRQQQLPAHRPPVQRVPTGSSTT